MQKAKKYFTEGLIQLTILLSLVGIRVDIDSYLSAYYTPLIEINLGPSSAYTQTPFHNLRDTLDGYSVHPKCPELDYFFASRRLLDDVRTLGSPRFPTQLSAWLVHQVSAGDQADCGPSTNNNNNSSSSSSSSGLQSSGDGVGDDREHLPDPGQEVCQTTHVLGHGPCRDGACVFLKEAMGQLKLEKLRVKDLNPKELQTSDKTVENDVKVKEEEQPAPITQHAHSSTLEQENLFEDITALSNPVIHHPPTIDIDQQWSNLLSLSVTDLDELDSLVADTDITSAISQNVSLHDAMVTTAGVPGVTSERGDARLVAQRGTLFRLESIGSSNSDVSPGMALGLAALPFASVCNLTGNESSHTALGGCLDEAVFDQINQLGLEGLDTIDSQLMSGLGSIGPHTLEDMDSDSGLSLESSSGGPVSPGSSEMSSSSSYCEDECGATGYSSDVDLVPSKGISGYSTAWTPFDLSQSVWHDHSYSSTAFLNHTSVTLPHKGIKEEPLSDSDEPVLEERELSRDELRARAMCIPFSALQIVNMPVEEFLEVLDGHGFSPDQVNLLRDIRRRGKNKLAAQNCRKRKLDAITGLQEEVERLQAQRNRLLRDKQVTAKTMVAVSQQIKQLTRDVLAQLRDDSGQPLNPERFTLQCGANGRVVVQPLRRPAVSTSAGNKTDKRKKEKRQ